MLQIPAKDFKNIRIYFQLPVFLSHTIWKSLPFLWRGGEEDYCQYYKIALRKFSFLM